MLKDGIATKKRPSGLRVHSGVDVSYYRLCIFKA